MRHYQPSYFETRPDIVKIFSDLELYREFCVTQGVVYDEATLYNRQDRNWQNYEYASRVRKPRTEYQGRNYNSQHRANFNRSGNSANQ